MTAASLLKRVEKGDPELLCMVDAWAWAFYNNMRLSGGQYTITGHEYQIDPLQCEARRQCAKKATQTGWTEILVIRTLHALRYGRYPQGAIYLFPTEDEVRIFSKSRFKPLLRRNPDAIGRFVQDTDAETIKAIGESMLYFRGARLGQDIEGAQKTSSKLKSTPADAVMYDELDEMDQEAIPLAQGRMEHSEVKEEFFLANPTVPDYGIDRLYQQSDQRVWMIECQACGAETCLELEFPSCLVRRKDGSVYRACKRCRGEIYPADGFWIPQYPSRSKDLVGWWISHLNSIYKPPKDLLDAYEDPHTDMVRFHNLNLGMAYIAAEDRLRPQDVWACSGNDVMAMSHKGPTAAGVDVGKTLHVLIGQKTSEKSLKIVKMARVTGFNDVWDLVRRFGVQSIVFDLFPEIHSVRDFCAQTNFPAFGCQYSEHQKGVASWNEESATITVNRTEICDASHKQVVVPGGLELPRKDDELVQFVTEMCNVAKVLEEDKETGSKVYRYRKLGADHYRHALNYLLLAARRVKAVSVFDGRVLNEPMSWYF